MTTETTVDYEVETREVPVTTTYCDSCGSTIAEGEESAVVVANPGVDIRGGAMEALKWATESGEIPIDELVERIDTAITSAEMSALVIYEDACKSCVEELADGPPQRASLGYSDGHGRPAITYPDRGDADDERSANRAYFIAGALVSIALGAAVLLIETSMGVPGPIAVLASIAITLILIHGVCYGR